VTRTLPSVGKPRIAPLEEHLDIELPGWTLRSRWSELLRSAPNHGLPVTGNPGSALSADVRR
jgi:hypothetical protein